MQRIEYRLSRKARLGLNDELRNVTLRKNDVKREEKSGCPGSDPRGNGVDAFDKACLFLNALNGCCSCFNTSTFDKIDIHQNFRTRGVGEKLLLDSTHTRKPKDKGKKRCYNGLNRVIDAPCHHGTKDLVGRGVTKVDFIVFVRAGWNFKKPHSKKRYEKHRDKPRDNQ